MRKKYVDKLTVLAAEYLQAQDTDKSMTKYLKKYHLTISEYYWITNICELLQNSGEATTICSAIAKYFENHGFTVSDYQVGFKITYQKEG